MGMGTQQNLVSCNEESNRFFDASIIYANIKKLIVRNIRSYRDHPVVTLCHYRTVAFPPTPTAPIMARFPL